MRGAVAGLAPAAKAASSAFSIIEEDDDETEDMGKVTSHSGIIFEPPAYKTRIGVGTAVLTKDAAVLLQL
jgi:hypothetical protein